MGRVQIYSECSRRLSGFLSISKGECGGLDLSLNADLDLCVRELTLFFSKLPESLAVVACYSVDGRVGL